MSDEGASARAKGTERLLDILEHVGNVGRVGSAGEIAAAIGAPRSSVYTIADILAARGYLERSDDGSITLGTKIAVLGLAFERHSLVAQTARSIVRALADSTGEIAELNILDNWKQLVLIAENGPRQFYLRSIEGSRHPVPRTASGRLLVDPFDENDISRNIPPGDYSLGNGKTLSFKKFMQEAKDAKAAGYFCTQGLIDPNIACVSAPVVNSKGRCVAAVSLVLPLVDFPNRRDDLVAQVQDAARHLSAKIGSASFT